ncbi:MAG: Gfo/Idh/MocA family oxidoreductase [Bryobacteraceae bacterium]
MKIAVLGLGFMGSTHLKAIRNIAGAELAAVVSSDEGKRNGDLTAIQGNLGGPGEKMNFSGIARYATVEEALADPGIEAVDICLPTDQHAPVALAALRAGKHVLLEKPMALDGATAGLLVAEADRCNRTLMTAQVLRFFPSYRTSAELVKSGKLGAMRSAILRRRCAAPAWSKWLSDASRSGGGVFDLLIHDVDYALQLFGMPEAVSASGYEDMARGIDFILAQFHYPGGATVIVTGGWHHPKAYPFSMEFTLVGDAGTLEYSSAGRPLTLYTASGEAEPVTLAEVDGYQAEIEYFVECASTGAKPVLCPPEDSAAAVKLAQWMLESRTGNGGKIACRL